ncbi:Maltose permease MAL61 [Bienertia sinuspersici]
MHGFFDVEVAEAMAMRFALRTTIKAGFWNIVVETDCCKLFFDLKILGDIYYLASVCNSCSFSHVKIEGKKVAHIFAKSSKLYDYMLVYIEE